MWLEAIPTALNWEHALNGTALKWINTVVDDYHHG